MLEYPFPLPIIIAMPLKDMQHFNLPLFSNELQKDAHFLVKNRKFLARCFYIQIQITICDEAEPRTSPAPPTPKEDDAPRPQPSSLKAASLPICEAFFSSGSNLRAVISPCYYCSVALGPIICPAGHLWLDDNVRKPWPLGYKLCMSGRVRQLPGMQCIHWLDLS